MKLIDKDAIVAEIERLDNFWHLSKNAGGQAFVERLLSFLDTLEVKEVDLEKEFDKCCENYTFDDEWDVYIARRFFKLGFQKAQKGE